MRRFNNAWLKWERGNKRAQELYCHVRRILDEQPIDGEFEAKPITMPPGATYSMGIMTYKISRVPVWGSETGLLLGEVLQNYRAALDHLAWELVPAARRKALSSRQKQDIAFPMARRRPGFWGRINHTLPGVSGVHRALIERYQPYRRSTAGRAIRTLRNLSDTDKHRVIIPTVTLPYTGEFEFKYEQSLKLFSATPLIKLGAPVKQGTEIVKLVFMGNPGSYDVEMKGKIIQLPIFPRSVARPLPGEFGLPLGWAVEEIRKTCEEIITAIEQD